MLLETTIENHAWNGVIVPKCLARCAKVDIFENTATLHRVFFDPRGWECGAFDYDQRYFRDRFRPTFESASLSVFSKYF